MGGRVILSTYFLFCGIDYFVIKIFASICLSWYNTEKDGLNYSYISPACGGNEEKYECYFFDW